MLLHKDDEVLVQQGDNGLASIALFEGIREQIKSNPDAIKKINAVYLWKVTQNGKMAAEWSEFLFIKLLHTCL